MKDVIETVQKIRDGGDEDINAQSKPAEEPKKVVVLSDEEKSACAELKKNRAEWTNQKTTYENNVLNAQQLIQDAYAQEWDMTAALATNWLEKIKDGATQLDLVRKVFEAATSDMRKLENTFWTSIFTDAEKAKLAMVEVESSWLDSLQAVANKLISDWTTYQDKARTLNTWLNRYLPGYDYTLPVQQANAARSLLDSCLSKWDTEHAAIMAIRNEQVSEDGSLTYKRALVLQARFLLAFQQYPTFFESAESAMLERSKAEAALYDIIAKDISKTGRDVLAQMGPDPREALTSNNAELKVTHAERLQVLMAHKEWLASYTAVPMPDAIAPAPPPNTDGSVKGSFKLDSLANYQYHDYVRKELVDRWVNKCHQTANDLAMNDIIEGLQAKTIPFKIYSGVGRMPSDWLKWPKTMSLRDLNIFVLFQALQFQASHSRSFEFIKFNSKLPQIEN
mgnify:CR=1 FL=1